MTTTLARRAAALLLSGTLAFAACSDADEASLGTDDAAGPGATLSVSLAADASATPTTWTLECDPAGGTHPNAGAACDALAKAERPFEPVPADAICTEIYGGSAVGKITGTYEGSAVNATYTRQNGCNIARWDAVAAVFPGPVPGQPTPVS